jgi:hypothetical protein
MKVSKSYTGQFLKKTMLNKKERADFGSRTGSRAKSPQA